jgi:hypothetical protein
MHPFQTGIFHLVVGIQCSTMPLNGLITHLFLLLSKGPLSACSSLFIYSESDGHFGHFQVLSLMNNQAINIRVQVFMWT